MGKTIDTNEIIIKMYADNQIALHNCFKMSFDKL